MRFDYFIDYLMLIVFLMWIEFDSMTFKLDGESKQISKGIYHPV